MFGRDAPHSGGMDDGARGTLTDVTSPNPGPDGPQLVAFAAGCFWHVEEAYRVVPGVVRTEAGYAAGPPGVAAEATPCRRDTGHVEAVRVWFDPAIVSLDRLLEVFWARHDPAARHRVEGGPEYRYRSAVFVTTEEQRAAAERSIAHERERRGAHVDVTTQVVLDAPFQPAGASNQQYLHRRACRRAAQGDERISGD